MLSGLSPASVPATLLFSVSELPQAVIDTAIVIHNSTATNLFILFPPFTLILFCSSPLAPFTLFSLLFVV